MTYLTSAVSAAWITGTRAYAGTGRCAADRSDAITEVALRTGTAASDDTCYIKQQFVSATVANDLTFENSGSTNLGQKLNDTYSSE